ncbi:MAG TPA: DinB family protein [Candidatus Angelobacter sp.]|nr:DinB family protein [Candidatus Angelobacter sp.]
MNSVNVARLQRCESQLRDFFDEALRGVPAEKILESVAEGKWSAHENLAHLGRYHEIFQERLTRILKEDKPVFGRYRAEEDPQWESWRTRPYKEVAADLAARRELLVTKLKSLSDEDYSRIGVHSRFGEMSLALWLEFFLVHEAHHLYVVLGLVRSQRA